MPTLYFEGSDGPLDSWELTEFLFLFRAAYSRALAIPLANEHEIIANPARYIEIFQSEIPKSYSANYVEGLFAANHGDEELRIARIVKTSPLGIAFIGIASALTLAVILSGGKIEISADKIKCNLPPIADGIERLQKVMRLPTRRKKPQSRGQNKRVEDD